MCLEVSFCERDEGLCLREDFHLLTEARDRRIFESTLEQVMTLLLHNASYSKSLCLDDLRRAGRLCIRHATSCTISSELTEAYGNGLRFSQQQSIVGSNSLISLASIPTATNAKSYSVWCHFQCSPTRDTTCIRCVATPSSHESRTALALENG